jgi:hypothetical protein
VVQPSIQLLGSVECGKHSPLCHLAKLEAGDRRCHLVMSICTSASED